MFTYLKPSSCVNREVVLDSPRLSDNWGNLASKLQPSPGSTVSHRLDFCMVCTLRCYDWADCYHGNKTCIWPMLSSWKWCLHFSPSEAKALAHMEFCQCHSSSASGHSDWLVDLKRSVQILTVLRVSSLVFQPQQFNFSSLEMLEQNRPNLTNYTGSHWTENSLQSDYHWHQYFSVSTHLPMTDPSKENSIMVIPSAAQIWNPLPFAHCYSSSVTSELVLKLFFFF